MSEKLVLNIVPLAIPDVKVTAGISNYVDKEQLNELRNKHIETHLFYRHYGKEILSVSLLPSVKPIGKPTEIHLPSDLRLSSVLARNAIINLFHKKHQRVILRNRPISILGEGEQNDILKMSLDGEELPIWFGIRLKFELDIRDFRFTKRKPFVGLSIDVRTANVVTPSVAELNQLGLPLKGFRVGVREQQYDTRLEPRLMIQGKLDNVESNGNAQLIGAREDYEPMSADDLYVAPRKEIVNLCIEHEFPASSRKICANVSNSISNISQGPEKFRRISELASYLEKNECLEVLPGIDFKFSKLINSEEKTFPITSRAPQPTYIFDEAGNKSHSRHYVGLGKFGPYSSSLFPKNTPNVCVVCSVSNKGRVEQFIHKLLHGFKVPDARTNVFADGLIGKFRLEDIRPVFFTCDNDSVESYGEASTSAIAHATSNDFSWDLSLVQVKESFKHLPAIENPYLATKLAFLNHQIPTQEFRLETAEMPGNRLQYALNNVSLACYAKLGGTPWLIRSDPTVSQEVVVGLGSASVSDHNSFGRERYVGMTTVFSGDGRYWFSNTCPASTYTGYRPLLIKSLKNTVKSLSEDMNWKKGDNVRIIFHYKFKQFSDSEISEIKSTLMSFSNFKFETAFVNIVESSPYCLFDLEQEGKYAGQGFKGVFAPPRASVMRLSFREILLSLVGPSELKQSTDGLPRPLLIKVHRQSTFSDCVYIARQVFNFSCHSWQGFILDSEPVTTKYSDLLAKQFGQLSLLPTFREDILVGSIGRTRWFL